MSEQRLSLWNAEEDLEEEVDLSMAIGNYGPNIYDDGASPSKSQFSVNIVPSWRYSTYSAAPNQWIDSHRYATSYGPTSCFLSNSRCCQECQSKSLCQEFISYHFSPYQFIVHFHQAVLVNNLAEITVAYESGWNKFTEKFYARTEWPEAELIAPLVNDGT